MDETEYNAVLLFIKQGVAPIHWSEQQKISFSHNCFVYKNTLHRTQTKLPIARRHELLKIMLSAHINPAGEHLEEEATTWCLKQHFHFAEPEMEVRKFIESCNFCLRRRLQHTEQLLDKRQHVLVAKMYHAESLSAYRKKIFDLQVTVDTFRSESETVKSKLIVCEAMNRCLASNNTTITEQLNRKSYECLEMEEKLNSLKAVFDLKSSQDKALDNVNNILRQNQTLKNMWHMEGENNKSLRLQLYEKSQTVQDLQHMLKKKMKDLDKMRSNVNFLQSMCSAQAKQVKELEKVVRQQNESIVVDDCEFVPVTLN